LVNIFLVLLQLRMLFSMLVDSIDEGKIVSVKLWVRAVLY